MDSKESTKSQQAPDNKLACLKSRLEHLVKDANGNGEACQVLRATLAEVSELIRLFEHGEREWRDAFDAVQNPIFLHDQHFRIIRANMAYARQAGVEIQQVIGKFYWEVFPKQDGPLPECASLLEQDADSQTTEIKLETGETFLSRGFAVKDAQGDYLYSVHLLEDVTGQRRLQQALTEHVERYHSLFEGAPDAIFLADAQTGQLIDANPMAVQLTGRSREELLSMHQSQLHPADALAVEDFGKHVQAGLANASHPPTEMPVLRADGQLVPTEISSHVFQLNGRPVIQGVFRNITQRKFADQIIHDSEEMFRTISNTAQDAVILLDDEGGIRYWNPAAVRIFGYEVEDVIGHNMHQLLAPNGYQEAWQAVWPRFQKTGKGKIIGTVLELSALRRGGVEFPIELSISAVQIRDRWHAVGILRDITERKHAEEKLHETGNQLSLSLSLLKGVVESVPIRVFWKDQDLKYLGCNTLFAKDAGLATPDELIGKTDFEMGWRDHAELYREDDRRVMDSGVPKLAYEEPQTTPDGRTIWLRTSKVPLQNNAQEVIGILGIYDDITLQKQAEQNLLLSESRLKEAQGVAHLGSWELDLVKNDLWWSDENHRIFGIEPNERNTYETFLNTVHPEDREFVNQAFTDAVKNQTPYDIEHRLLMPDGTVKYVHERCKTHYADDGTPLRSAGTTLDITEQKRTEAQASRLGRILNSSINEIYVFDAHSLKFILVNKGALQNLGYDMAEMSEMTPLDLKPEFTAQQFDDVIAPLRHNENKVEVFETIHRRKDGSQYPVEVHLQFSAVETPPVFMATILDISERRKADERLRHSEAGLAEAQRLAHLGNWEFDIVNNVMTWSDEIYRIFEVNPQQFGASYEAAFTAVHPDDREWVDRAYHESVANRTPHDITHRLLMPDGRIKYVREMCETHYSNDGSPLRSQGTVQDITEQHLAEQALSLSNRALKAISSCNSVLVHATDEAELLDNMCHVIINEGGYHFAWIGLVKEGEEKHVQPVAHAGFEDDYLQQVTFTYDDSEHGNGPAGCAVRHGEPQVVHDTLTDPHFAPWRDAAVKRGYRSVLALPLITDNEKVFGVLSINASETNAFDTEAVKLMQELANDLGFGIVALRTRRERDHYLQAHQQSDERYKQVLVDTIRAMSLTVEKRDPYTAGHQNRVALLSVAIGRELGMDENRLEGLRLGATIHDIGKIYVPSEILNRPGRLSKAEFEIIKSHSEVGYDIIKDVQFPWPVADMVLQHHERIDGTGYPKGLHGDDIILEARILAVADVVEAISAHRPYRPAVGLDKALLEIEANRDKLYDGGVVDACLHLIRDQGFIFNEEKAS